MKLFFSVGEPSGDVHGANLIRDLTQLHSAVECHGLGGPKMASAGCHLQFELTSLAIMGFLPVIKSYSTFRRLLHEVERRFRDEEFDGVVLIDYPGFNWHVARRAQRYGVPVFYYGVPQMWGWAPWRIRKMRRYVDHALCKLPFEQNWFRQRGCPAQFVGHPFFDEIARQPIDEAFVADCRQARPLVLLLAGSRDQEVRTHTPVLLDAAAEVQRQAPTTRFAFGCVKESQRREVQAAIAARGLRIDAFCGKTPELIRAADACIACSGSVSLELMAQSVPTVIVYRISKLQWAAQAFMRTAKYITLVNLLAAASIEREDWSTYDPDRPGAEQVPFPEYLTVDDRSSDIAAHVVRWLKQPQERQRQVEWLQRLTRRFGQTGASVNAARVILSELGREPMPEAKPRRGDAA